MAEYYQCQDCQQSIKIINTGTGKLTCCGKPMHMMDRFESSDDILDFAMAREQEAHDFYSHWAQQAKQSSIQEVFKDFAKDELKHKDILKRAKQGKVLRPSNKQIEDMKIADYLVDITPTPDMNYQQALVIAMKREKVSFKLYSQLAAMTDNPELQTTLHALAQEEAKHKLRLETLYEKDILIWD
jgi:desulfoferrodoxin-like iron-binding protein